VAFLEKAAGQGHTHAMHMLGELHRLRREHEQAVGWFTMGAEAGLPESKLTLAFCLDTGEGVAAPDYPAAADWYRQAADAGECEAANNLSHMYSVCRGRAWQIF